MYVCSLSPREVSMSTLEGLCTQKFSASVLTLLTSSLCQRTPHIIPRMTLFFKQGTPEVLFSPWILVTVEETEAQEGEENS